MAVSGKVTYLRGPLALEYIVFLKIVTRHDNPDLKIAYM